MGAGEVARAVAALRAGGVVLLPTDGVYGLCAATDEDAVAALYALKGRERERPAAIVAASVESLLERLPELRGGLERVVRALLPGPYTLVLPNPARRYGWLAGTTPEAIGVRVAALPPPSQRVLDALGAVAATSANLPGGPAPASLDEVPDEIRSRCAAELDGGRLAGTASTVIDLTGAEPVVLRAGSGAVDSALARAAAALAAPGGA